MKNTTTNNSTEILAKANLKLSPKAAEAMQLLISFSLELIIDWINVYIDRDIRSEFVISLERVPQVLTNRGKKNLEFELQTIADVTGVRPDVVYSLYRKYFLKDNVVLMSVFNEAISQFAGNIDSATIESGMLIVKLSCATAPKEELVDISDKPTMLNNECETKGGETKADATIAIVCPIREADPIDTPLIEVVDVEIDSDVKATAS